jgi:hypothetical protein
MDIVPARHLTDKRWDAANLSLGGDISSSSMWRDLACTISPGKSDASFAISRSGGIIALVPLIAYRRYGLVRAVSLPYQMGGIIGDNTEAVTGLATNHLREHFDAYEVHSHSLQTGPRDAIVREMRVSVVNLARGEEAVFSALPQSLQRDIIQKRNRIVLRAAENRHDLRSIQQIYKARMNELKTPTRYNDAVFEKILGFPETYRKATLLSLADGRDIAFSIAVVFGTQSYYFAGSALRGFSRFSPNTKLIWDDLRWAMARGALSYHMGGGTSWGVSDSLYKYKIRWGQASQDYWVYEPYSGRGVAFGIAQSILKHPLVEPMFRNLR